MLVDSSKAKGIGTDKDGKLFHSDEHAVQEIFQRGKTSVEHALFQDAFHDPALQIAEVHHPQINMRAINAVYDHAFIHAGRMDGGTHHTGIVDIEFRTVEPATIVEYGH